MVILVIIILIIAAATGTLWQVLEIAAGVAVGIFLAAALLVVAAYAWIRRRLSGGRRPAGRARRY
ncbi:MAG: hypothetical protein M3245_02345 [Actinomycetota bacterium]|nr:hypothetical protein [Actinomycetota bacterium]